MNERGLSRNAQESLTTAKPDVTGPFRKHRVRSYRYIRYRVPNEMITKDLAADVSERAYRHSDSRVNPLLFSHVPGQSPRAFRVQR
jgi:DNA-directed RNA polymerase specialized sigma24 family protein